MFLLDLKLASHRLVLSPMLYTLFKKITFLTYTTTRKGELLLIFSGGNYSGEPLSSGTNLPTDVEGIAKKHHVHPTLVAQVKDFNPDLTKRRP